MTNQSEEYKLYSTADLGTAVYLFTIGHELKETTRQGAKRLIFHFAMQGDTKAQILEYTNGTGNAPAKRLFENYRALRAIAFERTGNLK